jgi:hypothetical protein
MLPIKAAMTAGQWIWRSAAQASAVPTTTGVVDKLRVRGRVATIQADIFMTADFFTAEVFSSGTQARVAGMRVMGSRGPGRCLRQH